MADQVREAFMDWVQDRGCDTDGAWSAWQAAWRTGRNALVNELDEADKEDAASHAAEVEALRSALHEILRVHANDDIRPKAFYIASAALKGDKP